MEVREPKGIGRCRMAVLDDASADALEPFVTGSVQPGARVITDGWTGYGCLAGLGYIANGAASARPARTARTPAGSCLPCTGSPRWPSGG